jgi:surface protein
MSDTLKKIADNLGVTTINGNYLSGIADYYGVDLATSTDLMADILTEVGGNPATSTDYLQDIVLELGGTVTINGNWMEAWEAITATPPVLFTTEWTTTAPSEQILLPYTLNGTYTGTIDWGDGNTDVNDGTITTHTYATAGTYTVIIDGDCIGWDVGNTISETYYLTSVVNWGQLQLGTDNYGYNFAFCYNLDLSSVSDTLDLTGVTNFNGLFDNSTSLTTINNINSWDTSAVTNMSTMFSSCSVFNQALSFDTSAVTDMGLMFIGCTSFNQALSFDTSAVTSMNGMFANCTAFNQALSFDTSAVENMFRMFKNATAFNQNISSWDTSAVTDMGEMFYGCSVFNQPLSFDTSAVRDMSRMFRDATAFNQNISSWNTGAVTNMGEMFRDAPAFNQNIGTWNVANVEDFMGFMGSKTPATFSTTNLNAIYNGWSTQAVQSSLVISFGTAKYTAAATAGRLILTGTALWTIADGGL